MSNSRSTSMYWGVGLVILLVTYAASPPLLVVVCKGGTPGSKSESFLEVFYKPLQMLYDVSPWYKQYIDVTYKMAMQ